MAGITPINDAERNALPMSSVIANPCTYKADRRIGKAAG